jgi:ornithine carbamoyltransferase
VTRHLLDIDDLSAEELDEVLLLGEDPRPPAVLDGRGVALVFEKASNRTRNSSEMAVVALGGHPVTIEAREVGIDARESAEDVARTLACYHRVIGARVYDHRVLVRMCAALDAEGFPFPVPVVNLLSDHAHPCQAVADLLTLREVLAPRAVAAGGGPVPLAGRSLAYVGDTNNMCRSLAKAGVLVGMDVRVASPAGYGPGPVDVAEWAALASAAGRGGRVTVTTDPTEAADGADALYTDVWTSMGQEDEAAARREAFAGFRIDAALVKAAAPEATVLHCLPAHRGEEITADVLEGPQSRVWVQAAHRATAMRGIFRFLVAGGDER